MLHSSQILQRARARRKGPAYSVRALARRLQISPSFLSAVLSGKKSLPLRHLPELGKALDMDAIELEKLKAALARERLPASLNTAMRREELDLSHVPVGAQEFALLNRWYFLPMLDLTTTVGFQANPAWIADRLGISVTEARQGWDMMVSNGYVSQQQGQWRKQQSHIRFPTRSSQSGVRQYHGQLLSLAREKLKETSQADFDRRFIGGMSVAVNPAKVEEAKLKIQLALAEAGRILTEGPCTEVYQMQLQFFPVTKPPVATTERAAATTERVSPIPQPKDPS